MTRSPFIKLLIFLALAVALTAFAPLEKTLGTNARIVYFHGAWVWAAMLAFLASGLTGAAGLITSVAIATPGQRWHFWSQAFGRSGLCFWVAFLPMSLYVMQANWNGLFLNEPRFRIPLNLAIVGLLLQVGLSFLPDVRWTSLANLVYGIAFFVGMNSVQSVLHPDSPILNSGARDIQLFFAGLFLLIALAMLQLTLWWLKRSLPEKDLIL